MATSGGSQLTTLCAVTSFLWLTRSLEGHQLIEQPRLSSLLVLLIAGIASFAVSFFSLWLPGANGRFDDDLGQRTALGRVSLPKKPRRYFIPGLVLCIIVRLEMFHRVSSDLQCSKPGIEAFLLVVVFLYELLSGQRNRPGPSTQEDKFDDMGQTIFELLAVWMGSWLNNLIRTEMISVFLLASATYIVASQALRSTFFCSGLDRSSFVVFLQWSGLALDGIIMIWLWRILAWARTTKSRLKILSGILLASALGTGLRHWSLRLFQESRPMSYHFRGLDSLYVFDVVVDGLTFSVLLISTSLLVTEGSPLALIGIITFLSGVLIAVQRLMSIGSWENVSPTTTYFALVLTCLAFSAFAYTNDLRSFVFIHRSWLVLLFVILIIPATISSIIKGHHVLDNHPIQRLIIDGRLAADRFLVRASISNSLPLAVQEYKDRQDGRDPPAKFDAWYNFTTRHNSPIIDHFVQIQSDISPFWGMSPEQLRETTRRMAEEPGIALVRIQNGQTTHNIPSHSPYKVPADSLVKMIGTFAEHLPDMELAVNLDNRPRILAPWDDVERLIAAGGQTGLSKLLSKRGETPDAEPVSPSPASQHLHTSQRNFTSVRALREMTALSCPLGTKGRSGVHWNVRDLCSSCARAHSNDQYLVDWPVSHGLCHQPDLLRLHGFHTSSPELRPLQELLPVFSRSKTNSYSDILIPFPLVNQQDEKDDGMEFAAKRKTLFWRGNVVRNSVRTSHHDLLHGGHQERLVRLLNIDNKGSKTADDKITILLPVPKEKDKFAYQQVPASKLNALLPTDIAFSNYTTCTQTQKESETCSSTEDVDALQRDMNINPDTPPELGHQYIVTMDTEYGPPPNLLAALRAKSVPFYASIFKEWYSERLFPWIHFVPVDLRWHALHGTMAYFTGLHVHIDPGSSSSKAQKEKREPLPPLAGMAPNKKVVELMAGNDRDARWIAEQGSMWAKKALRREDMEVYLFRLLLEWGRLVSDDRDKMGFVL
ncbi:glycosyltransferase family 90 protein [Apodospora peruviana]|uniref:Glycosyltransferase family 90 protein n=1 Tax=Apodospora peruviana TaxID=516989 RepID=A0AAE0IQR1_9PEZI|nr:glycosyltransferase family 90 protein [Apodospora peruviana]